MNESDVKKLKPFVEKVKEVWHETCKWEMTKEEEDWIYEKLNSVYEKIKEGGVAEEINLPIVVAALCSGISWQRSKKKLKLFIWRNIYREYNECFGIAVATTKEEAIELLREGCSEDEWRTNILPIEPEVHSIPYG